ncbi:sensor histidine kinase [Spirosoma validum]|nr:sensor histidine kinase [Spirosoma validum]
MTWQKNHTTSLLIGILLIVLPVFYFVYAGVSWRPLNPHEHLVQNGIAYLFFLLFSYFNHTVFVPRWFLAKQYRRYAIVAISCVLAAAYLPYRIEQWVFFKPPLEKTPMGWFRQLFMEEMMLSRPFERGFHSHPGDHKPFFKPSDKQASSFPDGPPPMERSGFHHGGPFTLLLPVKLAILFLLGSVSTLLSVSVQTSNRLRKVENDQLQAELQQLKAQIHPHFLFNTLNSIYALAIRHDERTADTIVKLSEFMRYMIRDAHRDTVPLETEIKYIANYIDLQKARLQDAVQIDYRLTGEMDHWQIAPLLLFSFIENAFKYGVSPEEDSLITIHLDIQNNELRLYVLNNKVQISQFEKSTGVGLQNARERLRLLYPAAHTLIIDDALTHFSVNLTLSLS